MKQQTIENEFHVAMSAEKSTATQASTSSSIKNTSTATISTASPERQPFKPPRQKYKTGAQQTPTETTIENLESGDDDNDVSLWI